MQVTVSYLSCLQVPTAPPLDVSRVGASIVAALNSDAVLHAAVGAPCSESVTPEPVTPEPATPETFCQSAMVTPEPELFTYFFEPELVDIPPASQGDDLAISTRGRRRKAVDYSTSAQESRKMHQARQASGYWMSSRG